MENFKNEIKQIFEFAKRINFDIVNGDILELTRLWLCDSKIVYDEDNKEKVKQIIKSILQ